MKNKNVKPALPAEDENAKVNEVTNEMNEGVKAVLDEVIATKPSSILVLSLTEDGRMNINSNARGFVGLHYLLNRALFEINLHEKSEQAEREARAEYNAGAEVQ